MGVVAPEWGGEMIPPLGRKAAGIGRTEVSVKSELGLIGPPPPPSPMIEEGSSRGRSPAVKNGDSKKLDFSVDFVGSTPAAAVAAPRVVLDVVVDVGSAGGGDGEISTFAWSNGVMCVGWEAEGWALWSWLGTGSSGGASGCA